MATLIFTTLGTVLGGPIGGALGALAGQAIDAQIFKPKGRTGPRLSDLSVQTSRYGAQMPRIFGRMRVAGTVIWSTDLKEASATASGGKGQPSLTSYSYSASLAVALSSRPIRGIGRIWAEGNLLRGAAGDFKTPVGALRVHDGSAGQAADPLIAAAVGLDQAPAFRGLAYVVLEDLALADFGNRIPSLTVEVIGDDGDMLISTVASELMGAAVGYMGPVEAAVQGYAADGSDVGEALAPLVEAYGLRWRAGGGGPVLVERGATGGLLAANREVAVLDGRAEPPGEKRRTPLDEVPARFSVRHFDAARDYQIGVQSAERPGAGGRDDELGLPAVISADAARTLADRTMRARLAGRRSLERACDWPALALAIGDVVAVEGETGAWTIERIEWQDMAPRISLRAITLGAAALPAAGDPGQAVLPADMVQGATSLTLVELGPPDDRLAEAPLVFAAATGATAAWRRAALLRFHSESQIAEPAGRTAPRAVIGTAVTALPEGRPWTIDTRHAVEVLLDNAADALIGTDLGELLRGGNLCALGGELLQFGAAELIAPRRYRLSRLVRGWRGTEWAMAGHEAGERFALLDPARLAQVTLTPADIGRSVEMRASGLGDAAPAEAILPVDGRAILPPSPVHPMLRESDGDVHVSWTRRSRLGWLWRDLADAPLSEEREAYRVTVMAGDVVLRDVEVTTPAWTYAAAERAADLLAAAGAPLELAVRQVGTFGPSRPLPVALA
ncbi:MAG: phage tail protein [Sphingobium sp.]|nr:phage tail protein [Sphingobium sp.]